MGSCVDNETPLPSVVLYILAAVNLHIVIAYINLYETPI